MQRGQIFKKTKDNWAIRYYSGRRLASGRLERRQESGFTSREEAIAVLETRLAQVRLGHLYRPDLTVDELIDRYLAQHQADEATLTKLRWQLAHVRRGFGDARLHDLFPEEIGAWRIKLPEGSRRDIHQAFRQVLEAAVRWRFIGENPARLVPNPMPRRAEIEPFGDWREVEQLAAEMSPRYVALPLFAAGTGLRPEEWIALERRDIDVEQRIVHVRRVATDGKLKTYAKTNRSRRRVPLRHRVLTALEQHPARIDSRLLFPAPQGGFIDIDNFRRREWQPSWRAAGLPPRRIYDLRHTYATFSLGAGVSLFTLARRMGTSVQMIDRTYGHLAPDAEAYELDLLDRWDLRGHEMGTEATSR
jgi:integrase